MSKITTFIAAAGFALTLATAATAGTAYDNGGPDAVSGNEVTAWIQAEDFSVGTDVAITGAVVSIATYQTLGSGFGNVEYWIYGDSEGSPGGALANGTAFGSVTANGTACCGFGPAYDFSFDFNDAFHAVAGEQYWFGFHLGSDYERHEIYWNTTGNFGGGCEGNCNAGFNNGHESAGGTQDNWYDNGQEHAFRLTSDVPEPAGWALMILGFGAAGAALRRRRLVAA